MALEDDFKAAQARVKTRDTAPDVADLLKLYSLFKQGSEGDVQGKRPGMLDMKARAKFDAWAERKGLSRDEAMKQYIALVDQLMKG